MMELSLYKIFYLLFCCSCYLASIIPDPPRLLVISFDGFRHDYMNQTLTPNIYKLAKAGVVAPMKPSFVTKVRFWIFIGTSYCFTCNLKIPIYRHSQIINQSPLAFTKKHMASSIMKCLILF